MARVMRMLVEISGGSACVAGCRVAGGMRVTGRVVLRVGRWGRGVGQPTGGGGGGGRAEARQRRWLRRDGRCCGRGCGCGLQLVVKHVRVHSVGIVGFGRFAERGRAGRRTVVLPVRRERHLTGR